MPPPTLGPHISRSGSHPATLSLEGEPPTAFGSSELSPQELTPEQFRDMARQAAELLRNTDPVQTPRSILVREDVPNSPHQNADREHAQHILELGITRLNALLQTDPEAAYFFQQDLTSLAAAIGEIDTADSSQETVKNIFLLRNFSRLALQTHRSHQVLHPEDSSPQEMQQLEGQLNNYQETLGALRDYFRSSLTGVPFVLNGEVQNPPDLPFAARLTNAELAVQISVELDHHAGLTMDLRNWEGLLSEAPEGALNSETQLAHHHALIRGYAHLLDARVGRIARPEGAPPIPLNETEIVERLRRHRDEILQLIPEVYPEMNETNALDLFAVRLNLAIDEMDSNFLVAMGPETIANFIQLVPLAQVLEESSAEQTGSIRFLRQLQAASLYGQLGLRNQVHNVLAGVEDYLRELPTTEEHLQGLMLLAQQYQSVGLQADTRRVLLQIRFIGENSSQSRHQELAALAEAMQDMNQGRLPQAAEALSQIPQNEMAQALLAQLTQGQRQARLSRLLPIWQLAMSQKIAELREENYPRVDQLERDFQQALLEAGRRYGRGEAPSFFAALQSLGHSEINALILSDHHHLHFLEGLSDVSLNEEAFSQAVLDASQRFLDQEDYVIAQLLAETLREDPYVGHEARELIEGIDSDVMIDGAWGMARSASILFARDEFEILEGVFLWGTMLMGVGAELLWTGSRMAVQVSYRTFRVGQILAHSNAMAAGMATSAMVIPWARTGSTRHITVGNFARQYGAALVTFGLLRFTGGMVGRLSLPAQQNLTRAEAALATAERTSLGTESAEARVLAASDARWAWWFAQRGANISSLTAAGYINEGIGLTPESHASFGTRLIHSAVMDAHLMLSYRIADSLSGGRLTRWQRTVAERSSLRAIEAARPEIGQVLNTLQQHRFIPAEGPARNILESVLEQSAGMTGHARAARVLATPRGRQALLDAAETLGLERGTQAHQQMTFSLMVLAMEGAQGPRQVIRNLRQFQNQLVEQREAIHALAQRVGRLSQPTEMAGGVIYREISPELQERISVQLAARFLRGRLNLEEIQEIHDGLWNGEVQLAMELDWTTGEFRWEFRRTREALWEGVAQGQPVLQSQASVRADQQTASETILENQPTTATEETTAEPNPPARPSRRPLTRRNRPIYNPQRHRIRLIGNKRESTRRSASRPTSPNRRSPLQPRRRLSREPDRPSEDLDPSLVPIVPPQNSPQGGNIADGLGLVPAGGLQRTSGPIIFPPTQRTSGSDQDDPPSGPTDRRLELITNEQLILRDLLNRIQFDLPVTREEVLAALQQPNAVEGFVRLANQGRIVALDSLFIASGENLAAAEALLEMFLIEDLPLEDMVGNIPGEGIDFFAIMKAIRQPLDPNFFPLPDRMETTENQAQLQHLIEQTDLMWAMIQLAEAGHHEAQAWVQTFDLRPLQQRNFWQMAKRFQGERSRQIEMTVLAPNYPILSLHQQVADPFNLIDVLSQLVRLDHPNALDELIRLTEIDLDAVPGLVSLAEYYEAGPKFDRLVQALSLIAQTELAGVEALLDLYDAELVGRSFIEANISRNLLQAKVLDSIERARTNELIGRWRTIIQEPEQGNLQPALNVLQELLPLLTEQGVPYQREGQRIGWLLPYSQRGLLPIQGTILYDVLEIQNIQREGEDRPSHVRVEARAQGDRVPAREAFLFGVDQAERFGLIRLRPNGEIVPGFQPDWIVAFPDPLGPGPIPETIPPPAISTQVSENSSEETFSLTLAEQLFGEFATEEIRTMADLREAALDRMIDLSDLQNLIRAGTGMPDAPLLFSLDWSQLDLLNDEAPVPQSLPLLTDHPATLQASSGPTSGQMVRGHYDPARHPMMQNYIVTGTLVSDKQTRVFIRPAQGNGGRQTILLSTPVEPPLAEGDQVAFFADQLDLFTEETLRRLEFEQLEQWQHRITRHELTQFLAGNYLTGHLVGAPEEGVILLPDTHFFYEDPPVANYRIQGYLGDGTSHRIILVDDEGENPQVEMHVAGPYSGSYPIGMPVSLLRVNDLPTELRPQPDSEPPPEPGSNLSLVPLLGLATSFELPVDFDWETGLIAGGMTLGLYFLNQMYDILRIRSNTPANRALRTLRNWDGEHPQALIHRLLVEVQELEPGHPDHIPQVYQILRELRGIMEREIGIGITEPRPAFQLYMDLIQRIPIYYEEFEGEMDALREWTLSEQIAPQLREFAGRLHRRLINELVALDAETPSLELNILSREAGAFRRILIQTGRYHDNFAYVLQRLPDDHSEISRTARAIRETLPTDFNAVGRAYDPLLRCYRNLTTRLPADHPEIARGLAFTRNYINGRRLNEIYLHFFHRLDPVQAKREMIWFDNNRRREPYMEVFDQLMWRAYQSILIRHGQPLPGDGPIPRGEDPRGPLFGAFPEVIPGYVRLYLPYLGDDASIRFLERNGLHPQPSQRPLDGAGYLDESIFYQSEDGDIPTLLFAGRADNLIAYLEPPSALRSTIHPLEILVRPEEVFVIDRHPLQGLVEDAEEILRLEGNELEVDLFDLRDEFEAGVREVFGEAITLAEYQNLSEAERNEQFPEPEFLVTQVPIPPERIRVMDPIDELLPTRRTIFRDRTPPDNGPPEHENSALIAGAGVLLNGGWIDSLWEAGLIAAGAGLTTYLIYRAHRYFRERGRQNSEVLPNANEGDQSPETPQSLGPEPTLDLDDLPTGVYEPVRSQTSTASLEAMRRRFLSALMNGDQRLRRLSPPLENEILNELMQTRVEYGDPELIEAYARNYVGPANDFIPALRRRIRLLERAASGEIGAEEISLLLPGPSFRIGWSALRHQGWRMEFVENNFWTQGERETSYVDEGRQVIQVRLTLAGEHIAWSMGSAVIRALFLQQINERRSDWNQYIRQELTRFRQLIPQLQNQAESIPQELVDRCLLLLVEKHTLTDVLREHYQETSRRPELRSRRFFMFGNDRNRREFYLRNLGTRELGLSPALVDYLLESINLTQGPLEAAPTRTSDSPGPELRQAQRAFAEDGLPVTLITLAAGERSRRGSLFPHQSLGSGATHGMTLQVREVQIQNGRVQLRLAPRDNSELSFEVTLAHGAAQLAEQVVETGQTLWFLPAIEGGSGRPAGASVGETFALTKLNHPMLMREHTAWPNLTQLEDAILGGLRGDAENPGSEVEQIMDAVSSDFETLRNSPPNEGAYQLALGRLIPFLNEWANQDRPRRMDAIFFRLNLRPVYLPDSETESEEPENIHWHRPAPLALDAEAAAAMDALQNHMAQQIRVPTSPQQAVQQRAALELATDVFFQLGLDFARQTPGARARIVENPGIRSLSLGDRYLEIFVPFDRLRLGEPSLTEARMAREGIVSTSLEHVLSALTVYGGMRIPFLREERDGFHYHIPTFQWMEEALQDHWEEQAARFYFVEGERTAAEVLTMRTAGIAPVGMPHEAVLLGDTGTEVHPFVFILHDLFHAFVSSALPEDQRSHAGTLHQWFESMETTHYTIRNFLYRLVDLEVVPEGKNRGLAAFLARTLMPFQMELDRAWRETDIFESIRILESLNENLRRMRQSLAQIEPENEDQERLMRTFAPLLAFLAHDVTRALTDHRAAQRTEVSH